MVVVGVVVGVVAGVGVGVVVAAAVVVVVLGSLNSGRWEAAQNPLEFWSPGGGPKSRKPIVQNPRK